MQLSDACLALLEQLSAVVQQIDNEDYRRPSETLGQSTIGEHFRHTIEFFICLEQGFHDGVVNYDKRAHDKLIETDKYVAMSAIGSIRQFIEKQQADRPLKLEVAFDAGTDTFHTLDTNYFRELTYNIEHAVHHMAIMRIGLREVAPYVRFPSDFGIAASTIRFREAEVGTHKGE